MTPEPEEEELAAKFPEWVILPASGVEPRWEARRRKRLKAVPLRRLAERGGRWNTVAAADLEKLGRKLAVQQQRDEIAQSAGDSGPDS